MDVLRTSHDECVILLTGAPLPDVIDSGSSDDLAKTYLPAFRRFLDESDQSSDEEIQDATTLFSHTKLKTANWRYIPVVKNLLLSLNEQEQVQLLDIVADHNVPAVGVSCSEKVDLSGNHITDSPYTDFYVWHSNINCSQGIGFENDSESTVSALYSFNAMTYLYFTYSKVKQSFGENVISRTLPNQYLHLVPLSGLPTASDVNRLVPQTVTVSLLVIALKIDFKRQLRARRTGQRFDLVEILVGDDTQNKFSISIWLKSSALLSLTSEGTTQPSIEIDNQRSTINMIKTGDLLLMENIALATWKGCLYGHNLRNRIGNIETKIHIVKRKQLDSSSFSNLPTRIAKVTNWAMEHVGSVRNYPDNTEDESHLLTHMPPDTQ